MIPSQFNVSSLMSLGKGISSKYASVCLFGSELYAKKKIDKKKISAYLFHLDL